MLHISLLGNNTYMPYGPDEEKVKVFDAKVTAFLGLRRLEQPEATPVFVSRALNYWEKRSVLLAGGLGWVVDLCHREGDKYVPEITQTNQRLRVIPGRWAWEEFFNANCTHLLLWDYSELFIPKHRRKASYVTL